MTAAVQASLEVIGQEEGDARTQPTREFHRTTNDEDLMTYDEDEEKDF